MYVLSGFHALEIIKIIELRTGITDIDTPPLLFRREGNSVTRAAATAALSSPMLAIAMRKLFFLHNLTFQ